MKNELQTHLNALKGYVDMKFDVLKGMLSGSSAKGGKEEDRLLSTMRQSMETMMA